MVFLVGFVVVGYVSVIFICGLICMELNMDVEMIGNMWEICVY